MIKKIFKYLRSLECVAITIEKASMAIHDMKRAIFESAICDVLAGALGIGIGGLICFIMLYFGGKVVGLSASGITSGLAAAGSLVGGGMVAGIFVFAALVAGLAVIGVLLSARRRKKLQEAKDSSI